MVYRKYQFAPQGLSQKLLVRTRAPSFQKGIRPNIDRFLGNPTDERQRPQNPLRRPVPAERVGLLVEVQVRGPRAL